MSKSLRSNALEGLRQLAQLGQDSLGYHRLHATPKKETKALRAGVEYIGHLLRRNERRVEKRGR
jgi:hypothetical protein